MWVIAAIAFFLFYRLVFGWYAPLFRANMLKRPMAWESSWFHKTVGLTAIGLFCISTYCLYEEEPLLGVAPFLFSVLGLVAFKARGRRKIEEVIAHAAWAYVHLQRAGTPPQQINALICAQLLPGQGPIGELLPTFDLKSLLKYYILSELGLYDSEADMRQWANNPAKPSEAMRIDSLVEGSLHAAYQVE